MIELPLIYEKLETLLKFEGNWVVMLQFGSPFSTHRQPFDDFLIWIKPPLLEAQPEPLRKWRVPAVIAGKNQEQLLSLLEKFCSSDYSHASYWRNLRPLPPEEIGIWPGWSAFAVDLYIDFNHLCEV